MVRMPVLSVGRRPILVVGYGTAHSCKTKLGDKTTVSLSPYSSTEECLADPPRVLKGVEQGTARGLPGGLPDTRALGLSSAGSLEVGVLVWVPRKQPSMSGFEKSLLLWEGEEAPAARERGGDHQ